MCHQRAGTAFLYLRQFAHRRAAACWGVSCRDVGNIPAPHTLATSSCCLQRSLAIPISGTDLCFTSNLLDVAPLRTSAIPMLGSAAGSTISASEAATFRVDR